MPLHPSVRRLLAQLGPADALLRMPLADARKSFRQRMQVMVPRPECPIQTDDLHVGPSSAPVRVRLYYPPGQQHRPLLMYFHGGGWVLGDLDTHDAMCRTLAYESQSVLCAVDYRLAPEHPFPRGLEDCELATDWALENTSPTDASGVEFALMGDSAGANLALAVARRRLSAAKSCPKAMVLIYPMADLPDSHHRTRARFAKGLGLPAARLDWFWAQYLGDRKSIKAEDIDLVAPLRASHLSGLPATLLVQAQFDPLRSEGDALLAKMRGDGCLVEAIRWAGVHHGFMNWVGVLPEADQACRQAGLWVSEQLNSTGLIRQ